MEETVILKTTPGNKLNIKKFILASVAVFFITWIFIDICSGEDTFICMLEGDVYDWTFAVMGISLVVGIIPLAIFFLFKILASNELVVTNKRVYGKVAFGKRVDLPMDSISAVALTITLLKGIAISTSSGKICFYFLGDPSLFHKEISNLIIKRQDNRSVLLSNSSTADELKKYKDLLDGDIITQEEFDAKKKQLLGL